MSESVGHSPTMGLCPFLSGKFFFCTPLCTSMLLRKDSAGPPGWHTIGLLACYFEILILKLFVFLSLLLLVGMNSLGFRSSTPQGFYLGRCLVPISGADMKWWHPLYEICPRRGPVGGWCSERRFGLASGIKKFGGFTLSSFCKASSILECSSRVKPPKRETSTSL